MRLLTGAITVRLSKDERDDLDKRAADQHRTAGEYLRLLLTATQGMPLDAIQSAGYEYREREASKLRQHGG